VQALAVAKVKAAATAAAPHRTALVQVRFMLIAVVLRLTCSYLLVKESSVHSGWSGRPPQAPVRPFGTAVSLRIARNSYTG
jgi:hypothetical protein